MSLCRLLLRFVAVAGLVIQAEAAEVAVLSEGNIAAYAPAGKETDWIYGDYVIRNDRIVAVIGRPGPRRNANLRIHDVGGSLIDLTTRENSNDLMGALFPLTGWKLQFSELRIDAKAVADGADLPQPAAGRRVELVFTGTPPKPDDAAAETPRATATVLYALADGDIALTVDSTIANEGETPIQLRALEGDAVYLDGEFELGVDRRNRLLWGADRFWRQAYGVVVDEEMPRLRQRGDERFQPFVRYRDRGTELAAGDAYSRSRQVFPAENLLEVKAIAARLLKQTVVSASLSVSDPDGPVADADVSVKSVDGEEYGFARTNDSGIVQSALPPGDYEAIVSHHARGETTMQLAVREAPAEAAAALPAAGYVVGEITDGDGRAIACKADFAPRDGGPAPNFGPDSAIFGVRNLLYTPDGKFRAAVRPGEYDVLVSHGPEFDAVRERYTVRPGEETRISLKLVRSVDTAGWISAEYHSHSSPSGDNTSSQRGRVLNLLAEHIEFAPCTEHQRITTYDEHLAALDAADRMATCPGMELTGLPLPLNHQNAFPLIPHKHAQDGGGPQTDVDPVTQIRRLAMWDDGSDKLVQINHPNIPQMAGDRDLNGQADEGFAEMLGVMDVIEVHPPQDIFSVPESLPLQQRERGNTIFHWMQMLNQGRRLPGVINTDAHWNFHGSGWHRNYVKSETDDPSAIRVMDMVHASEHGQIVMTNGPFLQVTATAGNEADAATADVGGNLHAPEGKASLRVTVQCANWLDVNRVQVFVNGRAEPSLNFTRPTHRGMFHDGVVKFDETIELQLQEDSHLIVATTGEGLQLGRVYGPDHAETPPTAVANPIYVDVDGDGFGANGDQLGLPLPLLNPRPHSHDAAQATPHDELHLSRTKKAQRPTRSADRR